MRFGGFTEASAAATEWRDSARAMKSELGQSQGVAMCMYEGIQWLENSIDRQQRTNSTTAVYNVWNPNRRKLIVSANRIVRLVQKVASATYPANIEIECTPCGDDQSIDALERARVMEKCGLAMVKSSRLMEAATNANFRRCIAGVWGLGLAVKAQTRMVGDEEVPDTSVRAFDFSPMHLTLDPAQNSLDLIDHEYVMYSEAMTVDAIERFYGLKLNPEELKTIGELTPVEQELNTLSQNRLFQRYKRHSKTKGAVVHQVHVKDETGRFGQMWVMVETPKSAEMLPVNADDPSTPYGGCGMPMVLLHGQRRADSMWSIGDATLLRDDQMRLNLVMTQLFRQVQNFAGYQILADERGVKSKEDAERMFHNTVAGVCWYNGGTRDQPKNPPAVMQYPAPQPILQDLINEYETSMEQQVHRSDANFGRVKTHVPDASFQRAIEEADQVLGQRISEDIRRYGDLADVLISTAVKMAQAGAPSILAELKYAGFGPQEFASLASVRPSRIGVEVSVREASVRYRSHESKRRDILDMVTAQAITGKAARAELALTLDRPVVADDRYYATEAQKASAALLAGIPWEPKPLGEHSDDFVQAFRRVLLDDRAKTDPALSQLITQAIIAQQQMAAQELAMLQGALQGGQTTTQQQPADDAQAALGQIIGVISGQGSASSGQPRAA